MKQDNEPLIKALMVDDEPEVRSVLKSALKAFPYIDIIDEADNVPEAVRKIHKHKPNLIFLDIEMPDYSGLQILEFFNPEEINFDIIFVTAYDEYALEAFKVSAFDYLLKPVDHIELKNSLNRYKAKKGDNRLADRASQFMKAYSTDDPIDKIAVSTTYGIEFINVSNIVMMEASNVYTTIIEENGNQTVASKPIGEFENILAKYSSFFRPHRSFLINLRYINKLDTSEGDLIYLLNGKQIPLSRYKKKEFLVRMKNNLL